MKRLIALFILLTVNCFAIERLRYCDPLDALFCAQKYLPENPNILECGACEGFDTVNMTNVWPNAQIYSFEAIPYLYSELKKRTGHLPNVHAYQIALGDFCGKSKFYLSRYIDGGGIAACSSFLPPSQTTLDMNWIYFEEIEVDSWMLDSWAVWNHCHKIDFMWLDMQGTELEMLQVSRLAAEAKAIYIEVEFVPLYEGQYLYPDVKKWMDENNFELVAADFDPEFKEEFSGTFGNALFVKK